MGKNDTNINFWERFAFLYTKFMKKNDKTYDLICSEIKNNLSKDMKVLELACGTGQLSYRLYEYVSDWVATDYSQNMMDAAKKNRNDHTSKVLAFELADASNLNYDKDSFDAVVIANALHIIPNPGLVLDEIFRVLKPGGMLFAPTFVYEPGYKKWKIWIMEQMGFHTYHKWKKKDFLQEVTKHKFHIISDQLIKGDPLFECVLSARKIS